MQPRRFELERRSAKITGVYQTHPAENYFNLKELYWDFQKANLKNKKESDKNANFLSENSPKRTQISLPASMGPYIIQHKSDFLINSTTLSNKPIYYNVFLSYRYLFLWTERIIQRIAI